MKTLSDAVNTQPWQAQGVCLKHNSEIWFRKQHSELAKALCKTCPVLSNCHDWTIEIEKTGAVETRQGVYAAMTPAERKKIIWCYLKGCQNPVKKRTLFCSEEHKAIHTEAVTERRKVLKRKSRQDNP